MSFVGRHFTASPFSSSSRPRRNIGDKDRRGGSQFGGMAELVVGFVPRRRRRDQTKQLSSEERRTIRSRMIRVPY